MISTARLHRSLRSAYLAAGALSAVSAAAGRRGDRLTRLVKPTLMPLLAATAVTADRRPEPLLLAGLAGGWVGDVILMGRDSRSDDTGVRARNLNRGSAAFAVNQVAYIVTLWRKGHRPRKSTAAVRLPVLASGVLTAVTGAPATLPASLGYGSLLATTSVLAADKGETSPAALGADVFVLSDGLILARHAFLGGRTPVVRFLDGVVDGLVMATYSAAQLMLVEGIAEERACA